MRSIVKNKKQTMETDSKMGQMLDLAGKDFTATVLNIT